MPLNYLNNGQNWNDIIPVINTLIAQINNFSAAVGGTLVNGRIDYLALANRPDPSDGNTVNLGRPANGYYSLPAAIAAVPDDKRRPGLCITYMAAQGTWHIKQFTSDDLSRWNDTAAWTDTASNISAVSLTLLDPGSTPTASLSGGTLSLAIPSYPNPVKGLYNSTGDLAEAHPSPTLGDYAYVVATIPDPQDDSQTVDVIKIYECADGESWTDTGRLFQPENNQEFASGEPLNQVRIAKTLANLGINDVLSARLGNQILQNILRKAVNEEFLELLNAANPVSGYISSSTLNFTDNANASYKIIPVDNIAAVTVKANITANCYIYFLKQWTGHTAGTTAPLVDFQNYGIVVSPDSQLTIPVVADAKFMYVYTSNTEGQDTTPVSLLFTGREAATTKESTLTLTPTNNRYVRPFNNSSGDKNTWHSSANFARAVATSAANRGSILRVTGHASNGSYVAVLAETGIPANGGNKRALFAQAYGARTGYGGTVTIPAGQTVELYIPDDTAEVMFYYGNKDTDTYAPQSVVRVTSAVESIDDKISISLADTIDTSLPAQPSDNKVPSSALLAALLQTLRQDIPSVDMLTVLQAVSIPSATANSYQYFIGFNDESTSGRDKKWYSSTIKSWLMPVAPGEEYLVTASPDGRAGIAFLTSNVKGASASTPAWATGYDHVVEVPAGESLLFTAPTDAVVMYVYMANGSGTYNSRGAAPQKIEKRLSLSTAIDALNSRIDNIADELNQGSGILDLYPDSLMLPKFRQLRNNEYDDDTAISHCFLFAHVSDCHGGSNTSGSTTNKTSKSNWQRFISFAKHWSDNGFLDDVVDTGDIVANKQANLLDEWRTDPDDFTKHVKICIGNHDIANQGSNGAENTETDQTTRINLPAYTKFIEPNAQTWRDEGVVFPDNADTQGKCYYYKDYTKSSEGNRSVTLRAVFLDFMGWGKNTNTGENPAPADAQKGWLESVLADALESGFMVCIFMHSAPLGIRKIDCPFSSASANSLNPQSQYNSLVFQVASVVYQFQEQGGRFVGYFVGHSHRTFIGSLSGSVTNSVGDTVSLDNAPFQQLVFVTDNALMGLSGEYCAHDGLRTPNSPSHDSFWIIAVNASGTVKLLKIGFNLDKYMRLRDTVMVRTGSYPSFDPSLTDYTSGTVVIKDGLLWKILTPVVVPAVGTEGQPGYVAPYTDWTASDKLPFSRIVGQ